MAALAGGLVLLAGRGDKPVDPAKPGEAAPKAKAKGRRMSPQESFLEGQKSGKAAAQAEHTAELAAKTAREAEIDAAVAKRMKAAPKPAAAPAATTEDPAS